jgi:heptosyltransferase-3
MNTEFRNVRSILVIKLRHIGDVLLTAPVFRALRESFPEARLTALVNGGTEAVLAGNPFIDEIIVFDRSIKKKGFPGRYLSELALLGDIRRRRFDMTVDLTSGDRPAFMSLLSGARYRLATDPGEKGFWGKRRCYTHCAPRQGHLHTVLQNLSVLEPFGISSANRAVDFFIPDSARESIRSRLAAAGFTDNETIVHVHPTSRGLFKCWNDRLMADTIGWIIEQGHRVVMTSSPERKEMEKAQHLLTLIPPSASLLPLLGQTTIKELAAISERAQLFFGVDSAPMHIAAAVGTPVVALFGPSGAFHWGPWDNDAASREGALPYPAKNGCQIFGRHTVIQRDYLCVPCGKDGCSGSKVSRCLEEIAAEEVKVVLADKLNLKNLI